MSPREGALAIDDLSHWGTAAWLQVAAIIAIVVILHVPLGNYMASVYTATGNWRVEGDLPHRRGPAARPATLDEVFKFAAGLFGGQCAGPLRDIAFAGLFTTAVGP